MFPAADALVRRSIPFVVPTSFSREVLPERFRGRPYLAKPHAPENLGAVLAEAARERRVRGRAYAIREEEDRPEGQAERHWFSAETALRAGEGRDITSASP
jgi:hypothetical protein